MKSISTQHLYDMPLLIVDDEAVLREEVVKYFITSGFSDVREASSGNEAIALYQDRKADLIVTDIRMVDGNGVDFIRWIREASADLLPIIMCMTAYADMSRIEAYQFRVDAFFHKPFSLSELMAASLHFAELRMQIKKQISDLSAAHVVSLLSTSELELTPTEILISKGVEAGSAAKDIAEKLNMATNTVYTHIRSIRKKLGIAHKGISLKKHLIKRSNS